MERKEAALTSVTPGQLILFLLPAFSLYSPPTAYSLSLRLPTSLFFFLNPLPIASCVFLCLSLPWASSLRLFLPSSQLSLGPLGRGDSPGSHGTCQSPRDLNQLAGPVSRLLPT